MFSRITYHREIQGRPTR